MDFNKHTPPLCYHFKEVSIMGGNMVLNVSK